MNRQGTSTARVFFFGQWPGLLFCLWLWMGLIYLVEGNELESAFHEANRMYEQGEYELAVAAYGRLLAKAPGAASLHFNLGNAWFKAGQPGQAIWHYRVARDLSPRDKDVRENLAMVRGQVGGGSVVESRGLRWISMMTLDEWGTASLLLFWGWMGGLALAQLRPGLRRSLVLWVRLMMLLWLGSAVALGVQWYGMRGQRIGIAIEETPVRYGPFEESQVQFTARDGTEWRVTEMRDRWVQVDNGKVVGWVDRSGIRLYPEEREARDP
jgi:hypothetical protein